MATGDPPTHHPPHEGDEKQNFYAPQPQLQAISNSFSTTIKFSKSSRTPSSSADPVAQPTTLEETLSQTSLLEKNPSIKKDVQAIRTYADAVQRRKPAVPESNYQQASLPDKFQPFPDLSHSFKPPAMYQGLPAVAFSSLEKKLLVDKLPFVLVGKFSHGRPMMSKIKDFLGQLKLTGVCTPTIWDKKHIFLQFTCKTDYYRIWLKLIWLVGGFSMRVFKWTPAFSPLVECAIAPVWINVEGLPLYMFDELTLLAIGNAIGKPIRVDQRNVQRIIVSEALICIELDISKPLVETIWISFEDAVTKETLDGFWVKVRYKVVPSYCTSCSHVGHGFDNCKRQKEGLSICSKQVKEVQVRVAVGTAEPVVAGRMFAAGEQAVEVMAGQIRNHQKATMQSSRNLQQPRVEGAAIKQFAQAVLTLGPDGDVGAPDEGVGAPDEGAVAVTHDAYESVEPHPDLAFHTLHPEVVAVECSSNFTGVDDGHHELATGTDFEMEQAGRSRNMLTYTLVKQQKPFEHYGKDEMVQTGRTSPADISVNPRKLSIAAAEFTPKLATQVNGKIASEIPVPAGTIYQPKDSLIYKHGPQLKEIDNMYAILADEMGDIPSAFNVQSESPPSKALLAKYYSGAAKAKRKKEKKEKINK